MRYKRKLNQLDKDVSVLFFHNYFIDDYNKKYLNNKNLCPLNILKDLSKAWVTGAEKMLMESNNLNNLNFLIL